MAKKEKNNKQNARKKSRGVLILLTVLISLGIIAGALYGVASSTVSGYPYVMSGVSALGIDLSGMTQSEVEAAITEKAADDFFDAYFRIIYKDYVVSITAEEAMIGYDAVAIAQEAMNVGREGNIFSQYIRLRSTTEKYEVPAVVTGAADIVEEKVDEFISLCSSELQASSYQIVGTDYILIDVGSAGLTVSRDQMITDLTERVNNLVYGDYYPEVVTTSQEAIDLQAIYDEIYCEPVASSIKYSQGENGALNYEIVEGTDGLSFDLEAAEEMLAVGDSQTYQIPLIVTPHAETDIQDISTETEKESDSTSESEKDSADSEAKTEKNSSNPAQEEVNGVVFFGDLLGTASTKLNTSEKNRTSNIDLATKAVNGTVVYPGKTFSYNSTVGERTRAKGYTEAAIFASGEVVDGLGGGICQLSSTIYMASLKANLETVERSPHCFVVSYTPIGQDATVAWGSIDFKFKNTTDKPIKILCSRSGGTLTVKIYGTKEDDFTYKLSSTKDSTIDYETKTVYVQLGGTKAKELGLTTLGAKTTSGGKKGATATVYRTKYLNGKALSKEVVNHSTYKTQDKVTYIAAYLDSDGNPYTNSSGKLIKPGATDKDKTSETTTEKTSTTSEKESTSKTEIVTKDTQSSETTTKQSETTTVPEETTTNPVESETTTVPPISEPDTGTEITEPPI